MALVANWDIRVEIRKNLNRGKPFPALPSNVITAIVLSYTGYQSQVCEIL